MTERAKKTGWILACMQDPSGRRGTWFKETHDTLEICTGREGDDSLLVLDSTNSSEYIREKLSDILWRTRFPLEPFIGTGELSEHVNDWLRIEDEGKLGIHLTLQDARRICLDRSIHVECVNSLYSAYIDSGVNLVLIADEVVSLIHDSPRPAKVTTEQIAIAVYRAPLVWEYSYLCVNEYRYDDEEKRVHELHTILWPDGGEYWPIEKRKPFKYLRKNK